MKPETLIELIESGNDKAVEQEWMKLVERSDSSPTALADYDSVLKKLATNGKNAQAEVLAWAAIEAVSARVSPVEALTIARPFLLSMEDAPELRKQVAELYGQAYSDREGLDALLAESGLAGGRPVRRAVRTLDVALSIEEGSFLIARHEEDAAHVEHIDRTTWQVAVTGTNGRESLGVVHLADTYRAASPDEFRVMAQFNVDALRARLQSDPAGIVIDLCRERGGKIDGDAVEAALVGKLLAGDDWRKWWTRARTALKKCPNVTIEGRTPYVISYDEKPVVLEDALMADVKRLRDPIAKLERVETYLRDAKVRKQEPSTAALEACLQQIEARATELSNNGSTTAGIWWTVVWRVGGFCGAEGPVRRAVEYFARLKDVGSVLTGIGSDDVLLAACQCLTEAKPDAWPGQIAALLPTMPVSVCESCASKLVSAGWGRSDFEPVIQAIIAAPVRHFEALLWLWDGPSRADDLPMPSQTTLLSRIIRALDECRRSDTISKETAKRITARSRSVLAARKYERFRECLNEVEPALGRTLRNQIDRLDNLGRAVRSDLVSELRRRFPKQTTQDASKPWELEDVLYATEEGLAKKQTEIEHLVNVKMKENAVAIGRAAERGDLSENSEYKFALEERDLLRARLAQMNAEVANARVIDPTEVPTDHVGIGTKVTFQRTSDGELYEIAILGPWEADLDNGKLNYKTPLAQKVMGRPIGDTIEFDHRGAKGTYRIISLENALALSGSRN